MNNIDIDEVYNKYFFTIMDFKKATELFKDPDFDGEPVIIYEPGPNDPIEPPDPPDMEDDDGDEEDPTPRQKYIINGVEVNIVAERVEYMGSKGELITESYRDFTRKQIQSEYASLDDFLKSWNATEKKQKIVEILEEHGIILENLAADVGRDYGDFDLICHIAYDQPPLTRVERANNVKKRNYFTKYGEQARAVLSALLDKYADEGILTLENVKILKLRPFNEMGTPMEIINSIFGGRENYNDAIQDLEKEIYKMEQSA